MKNGGVWRHLAGSLSGTRQIYLCGAVSDLDWVNYLEKFHADGKEPRLTNIQKNDQITFFEHKAVAILHPELTKEFLKTKPKEWQMYIETMYSMAAGVEKKYWKFLRDMVVEKKERKKKKEKEKRKRKKKKKLKQQEKK